MKIKIIICLAIYFLLIHDSKAKTGRLMKIIRIIDNMLKLGYIGICKDN